MSARINQSRASYINLVNRWRATRNLLTDHQAVIAIQELFMIVIELLHEKNHQLKV